MERGVMKGIKKTKQALVTGVTTALIGSLLIGTGAQQAFAAETINVAVVNNPDMIRMESLVSDFSKSSGIKVKFVTLPDADLRPKVTAAAATKSGLYDVVMISPVEIQSGWVTNKWIKPLNPLFAKDSKSERAIYNLKDVLPAVTEANSVKGQVYGLPFYAESNYTMYRKDLFTAAGLTMPSNPTWAQITEFAKKLNDPTKEQYGIVLKGLPVGGQLAPMLSEIASYGARWFDTSWHPQLTSPEFKKAVTDYVSLVRSYGEPGASGVGFAEGLALMQQGKGAIWIDATVASGLLQDPANSKVVGKIGYAQAPTLTGKPTNGSHWLYAWDLALVNGTKHESAAFKFMKWATSKHYIDLVAAKYGWNQIPPGTRVSTYSNAKYLKVADFAKQTLGAINSATNNKPSAQAVPYRGTTGVYIPEWSDIANNFAQGLSAAVSGTTTVDAWLTASQAYAESVMKKAKYYK
jgi:sorbitol/mannitol transport system substrate-binding protein